MVLEFREIELKRIMSLWSLSGPSRGWAIEWEWPVEWGDLRWNCPYSCVRKCIFGVQKKTQCE